MACERYSESMIDLAAMGALDPKRERELLLHVDECAVCREAYRHAKEVFEALDRSVETLVAGEASPQFASRLRARIDDESRSRSVNWSFRTVVFASALASFVLVLMVASRLPVHTNSNPSVATNGSSQSPEINRSVPAQSLPPAPKNSRFGRASRATRERPLSQEVLVPGGQLAAALQLGDAVNGGVVNGEQMAVTQNELAKPLEVKPIEITPLETQDADTVASEPTRF